MFQLDFEKFLRNNNDRGNIKCNFDLLFFMEYWLGEYTDDKREEARDLWK